MNSIIKTFRPSSCGAVILRRAGFTLLEMIVVIVIMGIIGAMVAVFMARPVASYVDSARRAELSDIADTALRRIVRDLRLSLPNSVRVTTAGGVTYLEFLITSGGGRYRAEKTAAGTGNVFGFTGAITSFDVLGPMPTIAAGDSIVVYNLNSASTAISANAYSGDNRAAYSSTAAPTITITSHQFPFASPGNRFQVVQYPVTYACGDPVAQEIRRYSNYVISLNQPTPPAGGTSAQLARSVSGCTIDYLPNTAQARNGVVSLSLTLGTAGVESVTLFQEAHVSNVP